MPYEELSPLAAAFGAAGSYLQGRQNKQQIDYDRRLEQERLQQQAAEFAAQQALSQEQEKFQEGLYAPGQFTQKMTKGKYTQAHPGHPKGSEKIMTGPQQYVPGTGGFYTQQFQQQLAEKQQQDAIRWFSARSQDDYRHAEEHRWTKDQWLKYQAILAGIQNAVTRGQYSVQDAEIHANAAMSDTDKTVGESKRQFNTQYGAGGGGGGTSGAGGNVGPGGFPPLK